MPKRAKVTVIRESSKYNYNAADEQQQNIIGQRIAAARKKAGMNLIAASDQMRRYGIEISPVSFNKWELGRNAPTAYQLLAVCHAFDIEDGLEYFSKYGKKPELDELGQKKLNEYKQDLIASGRYAPMPEEREIEYIEMRVSSLRVSAGTGAFLDEGNYDLVSVPVWAVPVGADFGVRVSGDSMEPVFSDGQIVWVQKTDTLRKGEVGVFVFNGEGYIKAYQEQMPEADELESFTDSSGAVHPQPVMVSYNRKYEPRVVHPMDEFQVIGRVLK